MVTFTSSGNSGFNPTSFGVESGTESIGILLKNSLSPNLTGLTASSITLTIKADTGDGGDGTYKGFVQTAAGSTTFTDTTALSYNSEYTATEFTLPDEDIENNGIVGILIISAEGGAIATQGWDTTDQSGAYIPQRGNASAVMNNIRVGMTVTIVAIDTTPSSNITFPQIPEPKYFINSAFKS